MRFDKKRHPKKLPEAEMAGRLDYYHRFHVQSLKKCEAVGVYFPPCQPALVWFQNNNNKVYGFVSSFQESFRLEI